jgi:hypothetical protein
MRRSAPHVLLGAEVVADHPPAGAGELERDHRHEQDADERVHGHQRRQVQERRALDREEDEQQRRDDGGELLVAVAAAQAPHAAQ